MVHVPEGALLAASQWKGWAAIRRRLDYGNPRPTGRAGG